MEWKTSMIKMGVSWYLLVPKEIVEYLALNEGREQVVIEEKQKTKGRFAAFWKNEGKRK